MGKAQVSTELLAVFAITLLALLAFTVFASGILSSIVMQQGEKDARDAVQALARAADFVYYQGEGASTTVLITLPVGTDFSPNATYIGRPPYATSASAPVLINIRLSGSDIFATTTAPLSGRFPTYEGQHIMNVTSMGSFVFIGNALISASPSAVSFSMRRNDSATATTTIGVRTDGALTVVNVTYSWPYQNVRLNVTPSLFVASGSTDVPLLLAFTSNNSAGGIYSSQLNVTAYYTNGSYRETLAIPITLEVKVA